ncbi:hypothetical protein EN866_34580 [Mesorhizobium sp. M2D.F.Ca.ET.223.01.1.1]|uniref:hypothetical protein n=1 Tax=Mesorhizobium sp. M2D.F.Ca.ET.223.01.1.1 TaxID=2563940 RepID=UPI0010919621|nr:hypothetical protein [Mesorhizobium sp. M2D.F.Ca.ET.223.01.1.1]TGR82800.1 hypothetical protein EN866_34580 [Mesorhizobium sp. M2D.F.Ca.ET.223.01.1.1]TGT64489.1 hypothetical protein EN802_32390 [bacterium M00.F.Ca.ET.159.01.1.1]TGT79334.1 hypothetical protein EN800_31730 [bacterium M00.F.Ca.ET.157.01.1.1]
MAEIPQDIRETAQCVFEALGVDYSGVRSDERAAEREAIDLISKALAAERERCAKIADEFAKENWGLTELVYAGETLADAIRGTESDG